MPQSYEWRVLSGHVQWNVFKARLSSRSPSDRRGEFMAAVQKGDGVPFPRCFLHVIRELKLPPLLHSGWILDSLEAFQRHALQNPRWRPHHLELSIQRTFLA
ncbi:hypothetical protein CDAR_244521 [Caerostris darwini]|uniref:BRCT domain-containing protein n=1 Tax=Caerostris darwini TaxID=1538125 RepID=A0AAV4RDV4_9ARAC|nr:hypothetical protein CDAR_244521 [Caerostris darwini]